MGVEIRREEERDKERERGRERPSQKRHSPPRAADSVKLFQIKGSRYCFWNLEKSGFSRSVVLDRVLVEFSLRKNTVLSNDRGI